MHIYSRILKYKNISADVMHCNATLCLYGLLKDSYVYFKFDFSQDNNYMIYLLLWLQTPLDVEILKMIIRKILLLFIFKYVFSFIILTH